MEIKNKKDIKLLVKKAHETAKALGFELDFNEEDIIDERHLLCDWYYDRVPIALSKTLNGHKYEVWVSTDGNIKLCGNINGKYSFFKNTGVREGLMIYFGFDDEKLNHFVNNRDLENYLEYSSNNWFELHYFIDGKSVDACFDTILSCDLSDIASDINPIIESLEEFIKLEATPEQPIFRVVCDGYGDYNCRISSPCIIHEVDVNVGKALVTLDVVDHEKNVTMWLPLEFIKIR